MHSDSQWRKQKRYYQHLARLQRMWKYRKHNLSGEPKLLGRSQIEPGSERRLDRLEGYLDRKRGIHRASRATDTEHVSSSRPTSTTGVTTATLSRFRITSPTTTFRSTATVQVGFMAMAMCGTRPRPATRNLVAPCHSSIETYQM